MTEAYLNTFRGDSDFSIRSVVDDSTLIILNSKDIDMLSYTRPFCQGTASLINLLAKCHLIFTKLHIHPRCLNPKTNCQFEGEMVKTKVTFIETMLLDFVSLNVWLRDK